MEIISKAYLSLSTVLKAVVEAYRILNPKKQIVLGAPTGKASRRMAETTGVSDASTLHSILGLRGEDAGWQQQSELDADFVIVDETSMGATCSATSH